MTPTNIWPRLFATLILLSATAHAQNGGLKLSLRDLGSDLKLSFSAQRSTANGINNNGDVTGNFWIKGDQECFLIPTKGSSVAFYLKGSTPLFCDARAVDSSGQVAGTGMSSGLPRAFRRDTKGNMKTLNPVAPFTQSYGLGIYNGTVVGYMNFYYSAKWDSAGKVTNLYPSIYSQAFGVNSSGQIAGWLAIGSVQNAFLGSSNGTYTNLGTLGGSDSHAYAINASGVVVGQADVATGCVPHLAAWMSGIPLDMGCSGYGLAISSDNWIVGYIQNTGADCTPWGTGGNCTAFLATLTPNCVGPYSLNTLLDSSGAGWNLIEATGINDSHQIVGYGIAPNGEQHAFLLTPNNLPLCYPD